MLNLARLLDMASAALALLCILLIALVVSAIGALTPIGGGEFKWTCRLCWDVLTGLSRGIVDIYRS